MKYILFLNEDLPYTVKLYRKILGTKAQHSSCIFLHMYRACIGICIELKMLSPISFPQLFLLKELFANIMVVVTSSSSMSNERKLPCQVHHL